MFVLHGKNFCSIVKRSLKLNHHSLQSSLISRNSNKIIWFASCNQSTQQSSNNNKTQDDKSSIAIGNDKTELSGHVKVTERIKQTTKDVTNISVILVGIGILSFVFYAIFKEFFSSKSPSSVFASALKKCKNDPRVTELLGEPIKGHGEITARRRARHVSFVEYENNGRTYLRIKFYLKGKFHTATVHCETAKDSPSSHFRYLFVEADTYPSKVIIVEDNRLSEEMERNH